MSKQQESQNPFDILVSNLDRAEDKVKHINDGISKIINSGTPNKYSNAAGFLAASISYIVDNNLGDAAVKSVIQNIFKLIGITRQTMPALGEIIGQSLHILSSNVRYESGRVKKMEVLIESLKDFIHEPVESRIMPYNILFGIILDNIHLYTGNEGIVIDKIHQINPSSIPMGLSAMLSPTERERRREQIKTVIKYLFSSESIEERKKEIFAEVWNKNPGEIRILSEGMPGKYTLAILSRIFVTKKINEKNPDNLVSIAKEIAGRFLKIPFRLLFYANTLSVSSQPDQKEFREKLMSPIAAMFNDVSSPTNIFKEAFEFAVQEKSLPKFTKLIEILFSPELGSKIDDKAKYSLIAKTLGFAAINDFPLDKDLISSIPDREIRSVAVSHSLTLAAEKNATPDQIGKLISVASSCGCYPQDGSRIEDGGNNVITSSLANFFKRNCEKDSNWPEQFRNLLRAVQDTKQEDYLPMIKHVGEEFQKDKERPEIYEKFKSFVDLANISPSVSVAVGATSSVNRLQSSAGIERRS